MTATAFTTSTFPQSRLSTIDLGKMGMKRHYVAGLLEVDVTHARRAVRAANRGGDSPVSLLAWLIRCVAESLSRHPEVHGVRSGRRRRTTFPHVNMSLLVEREVEGVRVPLPVLFTEVDRATPAQIEAQIHAARSEAISAAQVTIGGRSRPLASRLYYLLPGFARRGLLAMVARNPNRVYKTMGSVVVTSLGMGGRIRGWFIPRSIHPMLIGVGAVTQKAVVQNGAIVPREILHLTIMVDHDVVDGAPAARWASDLVRIMQNPRTPALHA